MPTAADTPIVHHCHRRGAYHAGPKDPEHPTCPGCGQAPSRIGRLDDDLVGLCGCGTWTQFRRSPAGSWVVVERRSPQARHRAPQPPVPAAIAPAAG